MTDLNAAEEIGFYLEDNEKPVKDFKQECVEGGSRVRCDTELYVSLVT